MGLSVGFVGFFVFFIKWAKYSSKLQTRNHGAPVYRRLGLLFKRGRFRAALAEFCLLCPPSALPGRSGPRPAGSPRSARPLPQPFLGIGGKRGPAGSGVGAGCGQDGAERRRTPRSLRERKPAMKSQQTGWFYPSIVFSTSTKPWAYL